MMQASGTALLVRSSTVGYREKVVLDQLDLRIKTWGITVLCGPRGGVGRAIGATRMVDGCADLTRSDRVAIDEALDASQTRR